MYITYQHFCQIDEHKVDAYLYASDNVISGNEPSSEPKLTRATLSVALYARQMHLHGLTFTTWK